MLRRTHQYALAAGLLTIVALPCAVARPLSVRAAAASALTVPVDPGTFERHPEAYPKLYRQGQPNRSELESALRSSPPRAKPFLNASCPVVAVQSGASSDAICPGFSSAVDIPPTTYSFYALDKDLSDAYDHPASTNSTLYMEGFNEPITSAHGDSNVIIEVGCISAYDDTAIGTYQGSTPSSHRSDSYVSVALESWLFGYVNNPQHNDTHYVQLSVAVSNDPGPNCASAGANYSTHAADFYSALASHLYQYASYLQASESVTSLCCSSTGYDIAGGMDIETPWHGPDVTLPWVDTWNSNANNPQVNAIMNYVDDGGVYGQCADPSCAGNVDDYGWTANQDAHAMGLGAPQTWGFAAPEIYNSSWANYYADLSAATGYFDYRTVLWGCGVGDETTPQQAYIDFANATGRAPQELTAMHALGNSSSATLC